MKRSTHTRWFVCIVNHIVSDMPDIEYRQEDEQLKNTVAIPRAKQQTLVRREQVEGQSRKVQELLSSNGAALMKVEADIQAMLGEKTELVAKLHETTEQYGNIHDWAEVFDSASSDEKKMILARIIRKIVIDRDYGITIYIFLTLKVEFERLVPSEHSRGSPGAYEG